MNLDYEPARGKERELRAYREARRYFTIYYLILLFRLSIIMTGIKVEQSR